MKNYNFTAIDFETANWYRKSACSIGLVKVENGIVVDEFYSLIKPTPDFFSPINIRIHGITPEMCADAPTFNELWPNIRSWIDGQILVAHNASFEKSVLNHLFDDHGIDNDIKDFLCTLYLSRVHFNKLPSHKLNEVYYHAFSRTVNHHDALEDAKACAEIAIHVANSWQPPCFEKMIQALYETPIENRTGKKKTSLNLLQPDTEFVGNETCKGMNVTFTGELFNYSREEAAQFIVNRGGLAGENVTKATTHLVIGGYTLYGDNHKSGKFKRAIELIQKGQKIEIMSGEDFLSFTKQLDQPVHKQMEIVA